jgi:hypothetical protein
MITESPFNPLSYLASIKKYATSVCTLDEMIHDCNADANEGKRKAANSIHYLS